MNKPLFRDLEPEDAESEITEIESLCMNCHEHGTTKLLLTKIPFFKEVIVSSFMCEECGLKDSGIQSAGCIQDKGVQYKVHVTLPADLNRQVVKSEAATISIPCLEFEQPPTAGKKGEINTIEGLITGAVDGLLYFQSQRQIADPDTAAKVAVFVEKLNKLKDVEEPFDMVIDDPSGNSFVENPQAPARDETLKVVHYKRSMQQNIDLGLDAEDAEDTWVEASEAASTKHDEDEDDGGEAVARGDEVMHFESNCPNCLSPCTTKMKMLDIPFFKQVVIMSSNCEACGFRDNEVKGGSGIEDQGTCIKLKITDLSDFNRDVLKSDTCSVQIPELELELMHGTLGGRFTTVEGLLKQIRDQLCKWNPFVFGDSTGEDKQQKIAAFTAKMDKVIAGQMLNIHFILDDPAGNSYIQNVYAPDPDPNMTVEHYSRNHEQNDILGLNEMVTENYDNDS